MDHGLGALFGRTLARKIWGRAIDAFNNSAIPPRQDQLYSHSASMAMAIIDLLSSCLQDFERKAFRFQNAKDSDQGSLTYGMYR